MKILVTGGTGFVGSHLASALLSQGHEVHILGRSFQGRHPSAAIPIVADLRDRAAVIGACRQVDAVYHIGALSAPWGRREDFMAVNVEGTRSVIQGCQKYGVSRLIYVSSPSVIFDGCDQHCVTEQAPYPRRFWSTYCLSKKLGEDLLNAAVATGLAAVILRPKAIFGPGDRSLLPRLIEVARRGGLPQIGDGRNLVDLTFIDNVVHALVLALESEDAQGKTFHITNDEHVPLWPTLRAILECLGMPSRRRALPLGVALTAATLMEWQARLTGKEPLLTRYSVGILARTQTYDISAARRDLKYRPIVTVAEGIERTLASLEQTDVKRDSPSP